MKTFKSADILIPKGVEFCKWSVVACDQYTSQPEYWQGVSDYVKDAPSTLNLIFPEVYLSQGDERIEKINKTMKKYLDEEIFTEYKDSLFYIERTLQNGKVRRGIVGAIDLEEYDFNKGSTSTVRATEGTVLERIPPRVKIRENAPLEFPHIMILIDDEAKRIVEPLSVQKENFKKVYDFELMENSGKVEGYLINKEKEAEIYLGIDKLGDEYNEKYGVNTTDKLIFAVGDGNHSLATAKTCWENVKSGLTDEEKKNHPARYALCELVNLHDESLEFEPIHRVVFGVDPEKLLDELSKYYEISNDDNGGQRFDYIYKNGSNSVYVKNPSSELSVGTLQNFLDDYLKNNQGEVDYIHGLDVTNELGKQENNIGFILPAMKKNELFLTVIKDGALPRKTFSMGEACDKRFYIEGKRIK